jgi:hypothetical protein
MDFQLPPRHVAQEEVEQAFKRGGYKLNERFPDCGFVYFSHGGEEGRVLWDFDETTDKLSISSSWGFPSDTQKEEILKALALYVTFKRQARASA